MSGNDGHTFTSARSVKAFRGYAVCEQEDATLWALFEMVVMGDGKPAVAP
jgi:hypothetical protein